MSRERSHVRSLAVRGVRGRRRCREAASASAADRVPSPRRCGTPRPHRASCEAPHAPSVDRARWHRRPPPPAPPLERYEAVIGIEVHCQLRTASKMFCACSTAYDGAAPNTHVCPVCLGLPGALPVINRRAVEHVLRPGWRSRRRRPSATRWDRKNYFYPDLPKGYQISQYDLPLASAGRLTSRRPEGRSRSASPARTSRRTRPSSSTRPRRRAQGQPGRLQPLGRAAHGDRHRSRTSGRPSRRVATRRSCSCCSGRSAPRTPTWSAARCGSRRTSLRRAARRQFGTRVEVKNMNSFRSVERAIAFEIERQAAALDAGEPLVQETRGWGRPRRDLPHALEGDVGRLPLLPRAGPAATPRRPAWLDRRCGSTARAAGGATHAVPDDVGRQRLRRRRCSSPIRTRRPCSRRRSADGAPAVAAKSVANWVTGEYLRLRKPAPTESPVGVDPAELAAWSGSSTTGRSRVPTPRRSSRRTLATGAATAAIVPRSGASPRSPIRTRSGRPSTRSRGQLLARSPTTAPARRRPSASSWARS